VDDVVPLADVATSVKAGAGSALNAKVRQGTIRRTICKAGWTAKVRPAVSYTNALKVKQMPIYELGGSPALYEEDHLILLELGGAPRNPKNLWPEPRTQARKSDPLETKLKRQGLQASDYARSRTDRDQEIQVPERLMRARSPGFLQQNP
jgi:hypothetical protein